MDNMTIIAAASIILRGAHHGHRSGGTGDGPGSGSGSSAERASSAARRLFDDHSNIVRGARDDRIDGDLLFRYFDDPHLCQPVLESRHHAGGNGK